MNYSNVLLVELLLLIGLPAQGQNSEAPPYDCFVGSTLFVLYNFANDPPKYYQLNFGYRFTPKDVLTVEAITWTYKGPLGRPYGPDFDNPASDYPGKVQAYGMGVSYKRFWWKRLYTQLHATVLRQNYLDEQGAKIQHGLQLFNTVRLGYQFQFFKQRCFIEPSLAATFWPVNTNLPESFQVEEDRWNSYFLGEPGLHIGFNF